MFLVYPLAGNFKTLVLKYGASRLAMNPVSFLREVKVELEKVVWPGRKQVIELTVLVIIISLIIGIYVGGLDLMFTSIVNTILK